MNQVNTEMDQRSLGGIETSFFDGVYVDAYVKNVDFILPVASGFVLKTENKSWYDLADSAKARNSLVLRKTLS